MLGHDRKPSNPNFPSRGELVAFVSSTERGRNTVSEDIPDRLADNDEVNSSTIPLAAEDVNEENAA